MTLFPRKGQQHRPSADIGAAEDANRLADGLRAWSMRPRSPSGTTSTETRPTAPRTRSACSARAGQLQSPVAGDEAVRAALAQADPAAVIWIASRGISYMDEMGFPDTVEPRLES